MTSEAKKKHKNNKKNSARNSLDNSTPLTHILDDDAGVLLALFPAQAVQCIGYVFASVLVGAVAVAQFTARRGASHCIAAPSTAPPVDIVAVDQTTQRDESDASLSLPDDVATLVALLARRVGASGAVLLLQRSREVPAHIGSNLLVPSRALLRELPEWAGTVAAALGGQFWCVGAAPALAVPSEWSALYDWIDEMVTRRRVQDVAVVVVGRAGVGKSTLCRLIANRLLSSLPAVRWLDCDPGQGEFVPPGVVALHDLDGPLFGDALTHERVTEFSTAYFPGDADAGRDPATLFAQLGALFMAHSLRPAAPLVVNTPGWTTGIGFELLRFVVGAVPPTSALAIVELSSVAGDAHDACRSLAPQLAGERPHRVASFVLPSVAAASAHKVGVAVSAVERRDVRLLRHLTGSIAADAWAGVPLRRVPFDAVRLSARDVAPQETLYALNSAVVGLCCDAAEYESAAEAYAVKLLPCAPALAQCVALGLVRGIDAERRELFVYTSASSEALARVNTLVLGSVALPTTHVGATPLGGGVASTAPYISLEALGSMEIGGATTQRRSIPRASQLKRQQ